MTLVEILISSTIMVMLLGLAVSAFAQYSSYVRRVSARSQIQQDSIFIINHLTRDLTETNGLTVYNPVDSNAIIFAQPRELDGELSPPAPDGSLTWGRLVCYRIDSTGDVPVLVRQMDSLGNLLKPPDVLTLTVPRDKAYFEAASSLPKRAFRGEALALSLEHDSNPPYDIKVPLNVTLTMQMTVGEQRLELDNRTRVQPRH